MDVPTPAWLDRLPIEQRHQARCRFLLKLAGLYWSESGKMNALSSACDLHPTTLSALNNISPELAITLERVLGRDLFPRELFRPDLFTVQPE